MPFDNSEAHAAFLAAGPATAEPTTPAAGAAPDTAAPTVAADAGAALQNTGEQGGNAAAPASGQPATAAQAQAAGQAAADQSRAQGGTAAQQEAARQRTITAMLNGKTHELDPNLLIPMQRGRETVHFPLSQVIRFSMNHRDYTAGRERNETRAQELARKERELEIQARRAQVREQQLNEEYERYRRAMEGDDPAEQERMLRHRELMRTDPEYRKTYEDALAKREYDAQREVESELSQYEEAQSLAQDVSAFIDTFGARHFPDVDPEAVRQAYGEALQSGKLRWPDGDVSPAERDEILRTLVPQQLRTLFEAEAQRITNARQPVLSELEQMRAELAELRAAQGASSHNSRTAAALARSRNRVAVPAPGGSPPAAGAKPAAKPFTSRELEDRKSEWIKQG